jgi:acetoin utilization deacetylase AcuC-like enzyme
MGLTLIASRRFADHVTPPGHPERPERAEAMEVVAKRWRDSGGAIIEPRVAADDDLARVHDPAYVAAIAAARGRAVMLDPDTFTSPDSDEVARLAAGAALLGVDAAWARARGLARVAIVDFDVHHGNGTQAMFYDDPSVLFISSHQFPFYPGSGAAHEIGDEEGTGYTLNLPIEVGATDADYDLVYRDLVVPALEAYRPELLMVSAGFDAHERDPLGGMRMTAAGFGRVTARLLDAAGRLCEGRVVVVTEGGYDLPALVECLETVIGLASGRTSMDLSAPTNGDTRRGQATAAAVAGIHRAFDLLGPG